MLPPAEYTEAGYRLYDDEALERLQAYITEHYYSCTPEILKALGAASGSGGEFTENIDKVAGNGTAKFAEQAISIFCK